MARHTHLSGGTGVRDQWGDEDSDWFAEHVVSRVRLIDPR